jgi:hypothetical protein
LDGITDSCLTLCPSNKLAYIVALFRHQLRHVQQFLEFEFVSRPIFFEFENTKEGTPVVPFEDIGGELLEQLEYATELFEFLEDEQYLLVLLCCSELLLPGTTEILELEEPIAF